MSFLGCSAKASGVSFQPVSYFKKTCNESWFKIVDSAKTKFALRIKEAIHIKWEKPELSVGISQTTYNK